MSMSWAGTYNEFRPACSEKRMKGRHTMQSAYAAFGDKAARLYEVSSRTNRGSWDTKFAVTAFDIQASALMNQPPAKVQKAA